jgi:hypothetical protein
MNDELAGMGKKAVTCIKELSRYSAKGLRKTRKSLTIVGVPTDILTGYLPDTNQRHSATSVGSVYRGDNPSSRIMAQESTHPLTEMSTRNLPGGKGWPAGA